jgi:hypothetical protein
MHYQLCGFSWMPWPSHSAAVQVQVQQEASQLEEALRSKVDAQVDARLQQLSQVGTGVRVFLSLFT